MIALTIDGKEIEVEAGRTLLDAARENGAALLAVPATDTIKLVEAGVVVQTPPREHCWAAQTPQVFRREMILQAYADLPEDQTPTDDAAVVERAGHTVQVIATDHRNIKITRPGDMELAAGILKQISRKPKGKSLGAFEEAQW